MSSRQRGMTLVEVLVGIGILAILIFASLSLTMSSLQQTRLNMDRQFATQKAISILEELKSIAQNNAQGNVVVLDQFDDGASTNMVDALTIQTAQPGDPVSGNIPGPNGWLYERHVTVQRYGGQSNAGVRIVQVAVYRNDNAGMHLLAEVSSVVRTLATTMPPTQVYDVYAIAIDNVPGWWVYTSTLQQFVQQAISELQDRNPGLQFNVHWVTKLSYGRDQEYRPYVNQANDSVTDPQNSVYFYPGTLPTTTPPAAPPANNPPNLSQYYPPALFKAHVNIDGTDTNNYDAAANQVPFALADQFNNSTRYYDEKATFNARVAAGLEDPTTPTYRLLLDDMVMNPTAYTNAILINLHGELFPFPPVRNYSDPAKAPDNVATAPNDLRNIRVVTHPEQLEYVTPGAGSPPNINLRVYSYEAPTGSSAYAGTTKILPVPITVTFPGIDLTSVANTLSVSRIEGGVSSTAPLFTTNCPGVTTPGYCKTNALVAPTTSSMYATVTMVTSGGVPNTIVKLYNSPLQAPKCTGLNCASVLAPIGVTNNTGLLNTQYLYNQQYVPSPMENFAQNGVITPFAADLTSTATTSSKNTARWVIGINGTNLSSILNATGMPAVGGAPACAAATTNGVLTVETRIGDPGIGLPTTGTMWPTRNQPPNLSRTYVWRGTSLWLFGDGTDTNTPHLPMTERFQILGDPRHSPYADNKMPHAQGSAWANINANLGMGYNRYFDDFENTANGNQSAMWPGWQYVVGGTTYGVKTDQASGGSYWNDGWTPTTSGQPTPPPFGELEIDMPRIFQVLRTALTSSRAIYTTMTGYSYYYIGLGGEIGYDAANQFPNSIPLNSKPFTGVNGSTTEQSITDDLNWGDPSSCGLVQGCGVKYVRSNGAIGPFTTYWWNMSWLGEIYPDAAYTGATGWATTGNLPTGSTATQYKRIVRGAISPGGTSFNLPSGTSFTGGVYSCATTNTNLQCYAGYNAVRRTLSPGSTSLFWSGAAGSTFHHISNNGTGSLVSQGLDMANAVTGYNFPLLNPIPNNRPFNITLNQTSDNPESFLAGSYGATFAVSQQAEFYHETTSNNPGSALEALRDPGSNKVSFVVVNGLSPTGQAGSSFIARWSFLSLIHSYFQGGLYPVAGTETGCAGCTFKVHQLPRVIITTPNAATTIQNPTSIPINWAIAWRRWDNNLYTPAYSAGYAEADPVQFQVMFSDDNGTTWQWADCGAGAPAGTPVLGKRNSAALTTNTNCNWPTPLANFPMGNYLIRVEAYRQNYTLHYSYHQFRAFIYRN